MGDLRRLALRLLDVVAPGRADREFERELRSHLTLLEDEHLRRGVPPAEAARLARVALGGVDRTTELQRDSRSLRWLGDVSRDAGYALRMSRRSPLVSGSAVLSLALGIGACTAVFSVAEALLLRPLPGVARANELVDVSIRRRDGGLDPMSLPAYEAVRTRTHSFDGVFARSLFTEDVAVAPAGGVRPERANADFVSANYFEVLGVHPELGRLFSVASDQAGGVPVLVLSHRFWATTLNRRADAPGLGVTLNGRPFVVLGIASADFRGAGTTNPDLWVPVEWRAAVTGRTEAAFRDWASGWLVAGARVKQGLTIETASAELATLGHALALEHPTDRGRDFRVVPSSALPANRHGTVAFVLLLTGVVLTVLLVTCANVSGVLTARGLSRRREMAVRLSLGAHRARLVRQLLTETLLLYSVGGALGWGVALAVTGLTGRWIAASPLAAGASQALDGRVAAFCALTTLASALLAGLAPALRTSSAQPIASLKGEATDLGPDRRVRAVLLAAQVALTVALVGGGLLFARALSQASSADPGFQVRGVEVTTVDTAMLEDGEQALGFWSRVLGRVRSLPGVEDAALARVVPGGLEILGLGMGVPGKTSTDDFEPDGNTVGPHFFSTLGIPLVAGRDFDDRDGAGGEPVVIVGEAAARHFWGGANAVGRYLSRRVGGSERLYRVVGVARDVRISTMVDGVSTSFVYVPADQAESPLVARLTLITRTGRGPSAATGIRRAIADADPRLPAPTTRTLADSIAGGLAPQRVAGTVAGALGIVGMLLAAVGLYGATTLIVTRRLHELGIRIALGAGRREILRIALGHALAVVLVGCLAGAMLAAGAATVLAGFLFGVTPFDPLSLGAAVGGVLLVAAGACYAPVRRALTLDPMAVLRTD